MKKIGEGSEIEAYLVDNHVEKYFIDKPGKKIYLTEETVDRMRNIKTNRILLPTDKIMKDDKFIGYKMNYVENLGNDSYFELDKNKLQDEHKRLKEDIEILSDNKISIEDLNHPNTSYHKGLYLIDPGSYIFDDDLSSNQVYGINIGLFNEYLIQEVLRFYHLKKYNKTGNFVVSTDFCRKINKEYNTSGENDVLDFLSNVDENKLSTYVENNSKK